MQFGLSGCSIVNLYGSRQPIVSNEVYSKIRLLQSQLADVDARLEHNSDDSVAMKLALDLEDQIEEATEGS